MKRVLSSNVRVAWITAAAIQCLSALSIWLTASYLTTSLIFAEAQEPVPGAPLGWGLACAMLAGIAVAVWGAQAPSRTRRRELIVIFAASSAALLAACGVEAGLPAATTVGAWCVWSVVGGPGRVCRWLDSHVWTSGTVVLLLAAEVFLQFGAAAVQFQLHNGRPLGSDADLRILCIGDSFTYGIGASDRDHAWPGVLQAKLRAALPGHRVEAINAGLPGQNSSVLLRQLRNYVEAERPQVVLVCCGCNNQWNLLGMDLDRICEIGRSDQWKVLVSQAALRVRLYRIWVLSDFHFNARSATDRGWGPLLPGTLNPNARQNDAQTLEAFLADHPADGQAWADLTEAYFRTGRFEKSLATSRKAEVIVPALPCIWYARVHSLIALGSPEEALRACDDSLEAGCDPHEYPSMLVAALHFDDALVQQHLDILKQDHPELYQRLAWIPAGFYADLRYQKALRSDLLGMAALCKANGAQLVIHSYPYEGGLSTILQATAREIGCPYVDHWPAFSERFKSAPGCRLYVADGHCTDEGYALMAENLLPTVLERLDPRWAGR